MTDPLSLAADRLADLLARENASLAALDFACAAGMLDEKRREMQRFAEQSSPSASGPDQEAMRVRIGRLRDLSDENSRLLLRAIAVQQRVIGIIAQGMPPAAGAPRYGNAGPRRNVRPDAFTLMARA